MPLLPLWPKIAYTLFLAVIVPAYWVRNGLANFLWFSDIALVATGAALWLESSLLASAMAVGVFLPELVCARFRCSCTSSCRLPSYGC
jgi:hypothetical protein